MVDVVCLGEVMLRLSPPKFERLRQATRLDVCVAGSQLNVAADLAQLGKRTAFVSLLPANELGVLARDACQGYGVDVSHLKLVDGARMGVNYLEFGATPRAGVAIYDRAGSAASTITAAPKSRLRPLLIIRSTLRILRAWGLSHAPILPVPPFADA